MAKKKKTEEIEETFEPTGIDASVLAIKSTLNTIFKGSDMVRIDSLTNLTDYLTPKHFVSTGDDILDIIISNRKNGGLPMGKFINIYGDSASGKSLFCWKIVANIQKMGGVAWYFDTEHATFPEFVKVLGVDPQKVAPVFGVTTIEKIFRTIMEGLLERKRKNLTNPLVIIIDSMKAVALDSTYEDLDNFSDTGYQSGAKKQRVLGESLQKIMEYIKDENVMFVTVDQVRDNMNKVNKYSANFVDTAGNAQKFYSDIRLELKTTEKIKQDNVIIGAKVTVTVVKSRISPSYRKSDFFVYYTKGMDRWASWIHMATQKEIGIIDIKGGGYYSILDENGEPFKFNDKLPRKAELRQMLIKDESFRNYVYDKFCEKLIQEYEYTTEEEFGEFDDNDSVNFETVDDSPDEMTSTSRRFRAVDDTEDWD
jgi:recombination protein RecA